MSTKMVAYHRSRSSSYIETLERGKFSLPYGDCQLDRASSSGSIASQRQQSRGEDLVYVSASKTPSLSKIQTGKPSSVVPALIKTSFFLVLCYLLYSLRTELSSRESDMLTLRHELDSIENALSESETRVGIANISLQKFQSQLINLLPGGGKYSIVKGEKINGEALYQKITDSQTATKDRIHELQDTISGLHRIEAMQLFGHHRYRVMVNLRIDDGIYSFIVDMAPLELMPNSVHLFMKMVQLHAWDNTIISRKHGHMLLAELRDSEGNDKSGFLEDRGITTLSFPEYSTDYPHKKYTLGFNGRPGGPGFYINAADNRTFHDLEEEADSCFAKVTEGNNVIDWMIEKSESKADSFTVIDSIRMIKDDLD